MSSAGCGILFKLVESGSKWQYTILHQFADPSIKNDGQFPSGPLLLINGVLYGVTTNGGSNICPNQPGCGTIYKIDSDGTGYQILHDFSGGVSNYPSGSLSSDSSGNLYGTTVYGGGGSCDINVGCGAVFKIKTNGTGFTILHAFTGINGNDGAAPEAGVTVVGTTLYGTTAVGGFNQCGVEGYNAAGCGVIFALKLSSSVASERILHYFSRAGENVPRIPSGLFASTNGLLYGTTAVGGGCTNQKFPSGCGVIFDITTSGAYTEVYAFQGPPTDGADPSGGTPAGPPVLPVEPPGASTDGPSGVGAGVAVDATEAIWGATADGGSGNCSSYGCGAVYKLKGVSDRSPKRGRSAR